VLSLAVPAASAQYQATLQAAAAAALLQPWTAVSSSSTVLLGQLAAAAAAAAAGGQPASLKCWHLLVVGRRCVPLWKMALTLSTLE
jgi:hypothetical protein